MAFEKRQGSYRRLREAYSERTESVVFWIGAGFSAPAGLPNWPDLAKRVAADFRIQANLLSDGEERAAMIGELDRIAREPNLWVAFERLRRLGQTTYEASIREHLDPNAAGRTGRPPDVLLQLWKLNVKGVLTLNIDELASIAFGQVRPGKALTNLSGKDAPRSIGAIRRPAPFLVSLHGRHTDSTSWVFTHSELTELRQNEGYTTFIRSILSTHTVVFAGISAQDVAVGGFLEDLRALVSTGSHYWITPNSDKKTREWAENAGVELILYDSPDGFHSEVQEILKDLARANPREKPPRPFIPDPRQLAINFIGELPSPKDLAKLDSEEIRAVLNAHATRILTEDEDEDVKDRKYTDFQRAYRKAIHASWFFDPDDETEAQVFGYRMLEPLGEGGFGHVYKATDGKGGEFAIKLLHPEVFDDPAKLGSFRRGVRSMRFLAKHRVSGVVEWKEAFEMPAAVVMELVPGVNLSDAIESGALTVSDKIRIGVELVQIVRNAHRVPERVLHRDIRPVNIMLRNFFVADEWDVRLLDFDLSWHQDAQEKSIQLSGAGALAFAAPEQLGVTKVTTRSALVDSFGIGMTLFNLFTGQAPSIGQYQMESWPYDVKTSIVRSLLNQPWASLGPRLARLIAGSTRINQSQRWDTTQILDELLRLRDAQESRANASAEMWAEELLATALGANYEWDEDQSSALAKLAGGVQIRATGNDTKGLVELSLTWANDGSADRKQIGRYLRDRTARAAAALRGAAWSNVEESHGPESCTVSGHVAVVQCPCREQQLVSGLTRAAEHLHFS